MPEYKTSLEIIAPSVEEAIAQGVSELGLPEEELQIEVLDEGSKGLLGIGSRQARIRLSVRGAPAASQVGAPPRRPEASAARTATTAPDLELSEEEGETLRIARETVVELLDRMQVQAEVDAHWGEPDAPDKIRPLHVDVQGDDLSVLIGRRGETLNALQYISRLIVGKELKKPVAIVIDVEGYRARREGQLRRLARQVAEQCLERGQRIELEPMPANERRIIHLELRDHPSVYTESVGEGDQRKVTVVPRS